jgi:cytochrome c5
MTSKLSIAIVLAMTVAACGKSSPPTEPEGKTTGTPSPAAAAPADPNLAKIFNQTCKACHTNPGTGAPQSGDRNAWQPRLAQGMPTLVQHAINGYKGMPPMGSCMDCSEADFEALIKFMSGQSQ